MPLEAVAINTFDAPLMREMTQDNELRSRIAKLYTQNQDSSEDAVEGEATVKLLEAAFKRGAILYVGMFNDKPIAVVGCFDDEQTDTRRLQYLAVHPQNANRGIEGKLIKQVYDAEVKKGVRHFVPVDTEIHRIMTEYEMLTAN